MEIFAWGARVAVTVELMTGGGGMTQETRGTAVFHQQTISVPQRLSGHTVLTARQEYYYPGTNPAMITTVLAVQWSETTANMTAWLELMKSQSKKMIEILISTRTYKTALILMVPQV